MGRSEIDEVGVERGQRALARVSERLVVPKTLKSREVS
jgi:hypothetical protein